MSCNEWKEYKLGEIMDISSSKRIYAKEYISNGIPFYRGKEIIEKFKGNEVSTELFISEERFKELKEKFGIPKKGDILLTSVGTLGVPYLVQEEEFYFKDGNLTWFKNFNINCCSEFIYYWIQSSYGVNQIYSKSIGSTQKALTIDMLKKFDILLPPLKEQIEISNILSSLDNKIKLNNEMNKTLEEMAQSIFKRWFVDFEFPNEDGEPYKSSGGEMVDSEFGMIPNGWEVKNLDEVLELIIDYRGKTPKKLGSDWSDEGIMALSAKHIKDGNLVNLEVIKYVSNELYEKWMKDKLKMGDIIMTSEAPVGELYYINTNTEYCLSQRVYGLRSNKNILKSSLLYYMLDSKHVKGQILNRSTGTTVVGIRQTELRKVNVIVPPMNIQESISILLDKILSKKEILDNENTNLAQIRNSILPKLMNGEIKIGI